MIKSDSILTYLIIDYKAKQKRYVDIIFYLRARLDLKTNF